MPCDSHGTSHKLARPERFELLTPKFVECGSALILLDFTTCVPLKCSTFRIDSRQTPLLNKCRPPGVGNGITK